MIIARIFLLVGFLTLAGCASTANSEKTDKSERKVSVDPPGLKMGSSDSSKARKASVTTLPEAPQRARVVPVNGKVAKVNDDLRFVIIDFMNSRQPRLEQKLNLYRVGQKVGEVRVSGPYRNTTVAADLIAGEAKYGDEVRAE